MKQSDVKKMRLFFVLLAAMLIMMPAMLLAKGADSVVKTEWLAKNLSNPKLIVVDVRKFDDYKEGHIKGSINLFINAIALEKNGLKNELPDAGDLKNMLAEKGILPSSEVVIVGIADKPVDRSGLTRVAWTLLYAGVKQAAVLDGGIDKWIAEKRPLTKDMPKIKEGKFNTKFNDSMYVNLEGLKAGKTAGAIIVDVREPAFFAGEKKVEFVGRLGRIPGAVNLPAVSLVFNEDKTFKSQADLLASAEKVIGKDKNKNIIIYCDTGRFATVWALLLKNFGYKNVAVYDGSMQEYGAANSDLPMEVSAK